MTKKKASMKIVCGECDQAQKYEDQDNRNSEWMDVYPDTYGDIYIECKNCGTIIALEG
jgi:transcription elongation factor Elf1